MNNKGTLTKTQDYNFVITPTFTLAGAEYSTINFSDCVGCDRQAVEVTPTLEVDQDDPVFDEMIQTLNYDAISTYYKLNNMNDYNAAW